MESIAESNNTKLTEYDVKIIVKLMKKIEGYDKKIVTKLECLFNNDREKSNADKLTEADGKAIVNIIEAMIKLENIKNKKRYIPVRPLASHGFLIEVVDSESKTSFPLCPATNAPEGKFVFDLKTTVGFELDISFEDKSDQDLFFRVVDPKMGEKKIDYCKNVYMKHAEIVGMKPETNDSFRFWSASTNEEKNSTCYNVTNIFTFTLEKYMRFRPRSPPEKQRSTFGNNSFGNNSFGNNSFGATRTPFISDSVEAVAKDFASSNNTKALELENYGGETINGGQYVPVVKVQNTNDRFDLMSTNNFKIVLLCTQDNVEKRAYNLIFKMKNLFFKDRHNNYINSGIIARFTEKVAEEENNKNAMEIVDTAGINTFDSMNQKHSPYNLEWF